MEEEDFNIDILLRSRLELEFLHVGECSCPLDPGEVEAAPGKAEECQALFVFFSFTEGLRDIVL